MRVNAPLSCSVHPMGGTAYLSLESPDEPFLHGVKFTAMPPTKRFRDMEQLSGGEKVTPAAMLCFPLHGSKGEVLCFLLLHCRLSSLLCVTLSCTRGRVVQACSMRNAKG